MRAEEGDHGQAYGDEDEEDDAAAWEGWEVESESGSDSDGWISVTSDEEDLVLSDSDDDKASKKKKGKAPKDEDEPMEDATTPAEGATPGPSTHDTLSTLATTKVRVSVSTLVSLETDLRPLLLDPNACRFRAP